MKKGVIGYPLGHSYSKLIHEDLAGYTYDILEIPPEEFEEFLKEKSFDAINVTIPYKQKIIPFLDELDDKAKKIGAVNTVTNVNGYLKGYNTDYYGFKWMLENHDVTILNKKVVILGNGGATQALKVVINDMGARELEIVSRTKTDETITYQELLETFNDVEVLINASPVGMYPNHDDSPLDLSNYKQIESVIDIVYNPLKTELILQAEDLHLKAVGGLEMLVAQAKQAVEIFTGENLVDSDIERVYKKILRQKQNIVFIGMPSAGKTTLANELAKKLNLPLIDIDEEIVKDVGKSIKDIFQDDGEDTFRKLETNKIHEVCTKNRTIISCGGGVIKSHNNIHNLKKMGILVWIDRDVSKLISDPSRPLSKDNEAIQKLYETRLPLYQAAADIHIINNTTIEQACNEIESRIKI